MGCAECHDHKFDPFTQKQFYQMVQAFFNNAGSREKPTARPSPSLFSNSPDAAQKPNATPSTRRNQNVAGEAFNDDSDAAKQRQQAWEQSIVDAEKRLAAAPSRSCRFDRRIDNADDRGGRLRARIRRANPEADTYTITRERDPLKEITEAIAHQVEALPDPSLPRGGPGRDYYGNFMIREVNVVKGVAPVSIRETATDDG